MSHTLSLAALLAVGASLVGCQRDALDPAATASLDTNAAQPNTAEGRKIDPRDFVSVIDNRYFPNKPGTRFIYRGEEDGEPSIAQTDVTRATKVILGVITTVIHDQAWVGGDLKEDTFDWYAQDKHGNVWYFGEDVSQIDHGVVLGHQGSWEAGVNGAIPGFIMKAHPKVGETYNQELAIGIAEDKAKVVSLDVRIEVPFGAFRNCLKTYEFTPLAPDLLDEKIHCPGVGFVQGTALLGGNEVLRLVAVQQF